MDNSKNDPKFVVKNSKGEVIKEFDFSDPTQKAQAEEWVSSLSQVAGKNAQEKDVISKEVENLRHFKVLSEAQDANELITQVKALRNEGEHEKADELLKAYTASQVQSAKSEAEFDLLWSSFKYQNKDKFDAFGPLTEQAFKQAVKDNHLSDLDKAENQFEYLNKIFSKEFERFSPQKETVPQAGLEGGSSVHVPEAKSKQDKETVEDVWAKHMEDMGFSKF